MEKYKFPPGLRNSIQNEILKIEQEEKAGAEDGDFEALF